MPHKRLHIILLLLVIGGLCGFAQESSGGLLFTSSKEKVDKRTSLVLFGNRFQRFDGAFSVSFDLQIWDSSQFGHIFRVINKDKQEVEFVFVNFYGIDSMYLDFHSPITHTSVQIPITKRDIDTKETLHFDIVFNLKEDKAEIHLRDKIYSCSPVGLENPSSLQFVFGLWGLNLDVPQMLIKNLRIEQPSGKSFYFPLTEPSGNIAYEEKGKTQAKVKNPEWLVNKHFYWEQKAKFTVKDNSCVTYDEANNRILIVGSDALTCYEPRYETTETCEFRNVQQPTTFNDVIYNPYTQQCYVLSDKDLSSVWATSSKDLKSVFLQLSDESRRLHSNSFFTPSGSLYQFGGYGNHQYSNKISCYNSETHLWETLDFKGDKITPRYYASVGDGAGEDEKLLFGGFGNETGRQEHGGRNLYDLHVLNLKNKTVTRLWTAVQTPKPEFIPSNNLIISEDKRYFYALCYAHHIPKTVGYLYRFSMQNGEYDVMSDSIGFTSEDMNTSVNLFYNRQMDEFYAVICELADGNQHRIQIYSLLAPPISKAQLENSQPSQFPYRIIILAIIVAIFAVGGYFAYRFVKKKKTAARRAAQVETIVNPPAENEYDVKIQKQSAVYIFGNFTVYDTKGRDISYRFSMKLKALFSLILLNTNGESGISTENLTFTLWPDKDLNEAKNVRGVTVNRLRSCLEDIDGITLIHQNHQWFFVFEEQFYCDYLAYADLLRNLSAASPDAYPALMKRLVAITHNGKFLLSVQDVGLDSYKAKEEERLGHLLKEYIAGLYAEKQYQKILAIAPSFFAVEPLSEEILNLCIKSYNKLGKKEEAKTFLKNYKRNHKLLTGEEYKDEGK
ncbi:MAG: hypothetical protein LBN23_05805 [Paludibacter sp.]|jgi:two-component SAPR family response regulator|nr:hypothetical protein [Paludibacter sp.]